MGLKLVAEARHEGRQLRRAEGAGPRAWRGAGLAQEEGSPPEAWPEGASNSCCSPGRGNGAESRAGAGAQGTAAEGWETGLLAHGAGLGSGKGDESGLRRPGRRGRRSETKGAAGGEAASC